MEQEIMRMAMSQGIFAVLFTGLLFYVLRYNEKREERLLSCLEKLTQDVAEIRNNIEDVKERLDKLC